MLETASNKIVSLPNDKVKAVGKGVILHTTSDYCVEKTAGGLHLPESSSPNKKYDIGKVVAIGADVKEVKIGDVVVYQIAGSFQLPNGMEDPVLVKVNEDPASIMCICPPADK